MRMKQIRAVEDKQVTESELRVMALGLNNEHSSGLEVMRDSEGEASLYVDGVDLLDGVDVGGGADVEPEAVLVCGAHEVLRARAVSMCELRLVRQLILILVRRTKRTLLIRVQYPEQYGYLRGALHCVLEARVDDILLGGAGDVHLERLARRDRDLSELRAELLLERLLHALCTSSTSVSSVWGSLLVLWRTQVFFSSSGAPRRLMLSASSCLKIMRPNDTCCRFLSHSKYETVTPPAFRYRSCE